MLTVFEKPVGQRGVVCQLTLTLTAAEDVSELIAFAGTATESAPPPPLTVSQVR